MTLFWIVNQLIKIANTFWRVYKGGRQFGDLGSQVEAWSTISQSEIKKYYDLINNNSGYKA